LKGIIGIQAWVFERYHRNPSMSIWKVS